jgi:hypothetical protein
MVREFVHNEVVATAFFPAASQRVGPRHDHRPSIPGFVFTM